MDIFSMTGIVKIFLPETAPATIKVRSFTRKLILTKTITNEGTLDLRSQADSIYLRTIQSKSNVWVEKIIKVD